MERHPVAMGRLLRVAQGKQRTARPAGRKPVALEPRRMTLLTLAPLAWLGVICALAMRPRDRRKDDGST